jgi:hypothetical protein
MSAHANPNIITDGLAFMYDTGDGKSYKGQPTTNLNTFTLSDSGTDGSGQSSIGTRTVITNNHVRIVDTASNTRQTHVITGLTASTTYTVSIMYKKLVGTPTFRFQIQDYSGSSYLRTIKFTNTSEIGIEDKEGWQLASWTFTLGSDANAVRIWYQDGADYTTYTHSFELQNPQLEAKSHATPYVDGTRSATQGLIDRTGTSTINISNASFDSNAQVTLDGTNDYIDLGSDVSISPDNQGWTTEYWFNTNSAGTLQHFNSAENDEFNANWLAIYNSKLAVWNRSPGYWKYGDTIIQSNTWYQAVFICDSGGTNMRFYINGKAEGGTHVGNSWNATYSSLDVRYIGKYEYNGGHSRYFNGEIEAVKIYDRALTSAEVRQNFNATKDRFGL